MGEDHGELKLYTGKAEKLSESTRPMVQKSNKAARC